MILPDANLLIYAYDSASPYHDRSRAWLEGVLSSDEVVLMPWASILAFVRITTNPRAFTAPFTVEEAVAIVSEWLAQPVVRTVGPTERHWELLERMLVDGQARGPLASDAHLAALAVEHGAILHTTDRDFARFDGLRFTNPLTALS
jgi:toxin-antitoxin system PIN domain toxin